MTPLGASARRRLRAQARAALDVVRRHPRHVVLLALVGGLVLGPAAPPAAVAAAAVAAGLAGRPAVAVLAATSVLAGALVADARIAASGPGALHALTGARIEARAILLEPLRTRRNGSAAARVRILAARQPTGARPRGGGAAPDVRATRGEIAVVRVADGRPERAPAVGAEVAIAGRISALGFADAHQRRRGAHAAIDVAALEETGRTRGGIAGGLDRARERASAGLATGLPPPRAALLRGLVLGQDERIPDEVRTSFERSGLAHLLAVSGQNVLLLCALVFALATALDIPLRARLAVAVVMVALYVPLAGAGPSIQRAGVMGVAGLVAALAGRPQSRWYALGLAAAVTLVVNPRAAGEPGWQLSFAAVAGLLALAPPLRSGLARRGLPRAVSDVAAVTIAASLATAPLLALHFEQVSLVSLPANLAAAPVVAPVMWLGMLAVTAAQVSPALAMPLNAVCAPLLAYLDWLARAAAGVPFAAVGVSLGPAALCASYLVLASLAAVAAHRSSRWHDLSADARGAAAPASAGMGTRRWRGAAVVAAVGIAVAVGLVARHGMRDGAPVPAHGELVVTFLSVGQGDATLLQRDGTAVLVDTGPPGGPILRRLEEAGVRRLDVLVLTHAQADHEGMAPEVITAHRPRLVLDGGVGWPSAVQRVLPALLARTGARHVPARAGQVLRIGPLRMRVLWPPAPGPGWRPEGDPNDRAVVTHVESGSFDLLLPADAESEVTARLPLPRVDALKVAHHGSADEGLPALLERISPEVAAIEVGEDNRYGHPTPSTLGALRAVPHVIRTDRDGTVRLRVAGGRMRLERAAG